MKRLKNAIWWILFLIGISAIIFASFSIWKKQREYKESREKNDSVKKEYTTNDNDEFHIDWDGLLAQNPSVIGWIRFKDPAIISYPLLQGDTNQTWLRTGFDGNYLISGCIFLNCYNKPDFSDFNSTIYGHRMNDKTMFGSLVDFEDPDYAKSHRYFYIYLPDNTVRTYEIFAVSRVKDGSNVYLTNYATDEEKASYIDSRLKASITDMGVDVTPDDTIVSLSTCTPQRDGKRIYVQGVLVSIQDLSDDSNDGEE